MLPPRLSLLLTAVSLAGCGVTDASINQGATGDVLASASGDLTDDNGLDFNGCGASSLDSNGLDRNGIDRNGLDRNGIDRNGLLANAIDPTVSATFKNWFNGNAILNDKVMKYFVKCAIPAGTTIHWTNPNTGASYNWPGKLGLAPNWATGTPSANDKAWVSACMLAHINAKATPYMVSFRSPNAPGGALAFDTTESTGYRAREGAFWGNLFGPTIVKNTCYETYQRCPGGPLGPKVITNPTVGRSCTTSNLNCGLNIVGPCLQSVVSAAGTTSWKGDCVAGPTGSDGYASCGGTTQVITTFIAPFCGDGSCNAAAGENSTTCSTDCLRMPMCPVRVGLCCPSIL